jgi:tetratricopeptide (TPR) repeat protein
MNAKRTIVAVGMFLGVGTLAPVAVSANFPGEFKAAMELYTARQFHTAQDAFGQLAGQAPSPRSKAVCQAYAARSLSGEGQYEPALELARQIESKPRSIDCQMEIMLAHGKTRELVEAFRDVDIAAWPDDCIHQGFYRRGTAYRLLGNAQAASGDLEQAVANSVTADQFQVIALDELGGVYQTLNDDAKALDTYRRAQAFPRFRGFYAFISATMGIVNIRLRQGQPDEALAELRQLDLEHATGYWRFMMLQAYGDIALAQGRADEAHRYFQTAITVPRTPQSVVDRLKKRMAVPPSTTTGRKGPP